MPKVKAVSAYLADHENPEAAIEAAIADARSESAAARRFKRAYTPLVESLELPASIEDSDTAIDAARDASRAAVAKLSEPKDDGTADALTAILDELQERLGFDLSALSELPEDASEAQVSKALDVALKPVSDRFARADEAERLTGELTVAKAAKALGIEDAALTEWLGDRKVTTGKAKDAEGNEVDTYGVAVGDTFKPLDSFQTVRALKPKEAEPAPAPAPGVGFVRQPSAAASAAPTLDPVQARIQQRQEALQKAHNPLSAKE